MSLAILARTPLWAGVLLVIATLCYASIPSLNYYARGWEYPTLLTGLMRLGFAISVFAILALLFRPLLSGRGLRVMARAVRSDWRLFALAMLSTCDVALFSLSYRFVDISVTTVITAMTPAANVVILTLLNRGWVTWRHAVGLLVCSLGVVMVLWAGGGIETGGQLWRVGVGVILGLGTAVCGGLTVTALRLGEVLAVDWYWEGLGTGAGLVWCGSMMTLALAQGITAPLFVLLAWTAGMPAYDTLGLMFLMGILVLAGTALWALANGSGLRPVVNGMGYLQPAWALLILVVLGIAGAVAWYGLVIGLALIIAANGWMQLWGSENR